jgi:hypothetical protein
MTPEIRRLLDQLHTATNEMIQLSNATRAALLALPADSVLACRAPAPDRSGRLCDKPSGHTGDHWTYGGDEKTWPADLPPTEASVRDVAVTPSETDGTIENAQETARTFAPALPPPVEPPPQDDALDSEEFYNLMQTYRHTPPTQQGQLVYLYDDIKRFIRKRLATPPAPPRTVDA